MIINRDGKIAGKINIIDLLVVLAIAAAVIGISARFVSRAAENVREKTDFSYVVEIDGIRKYTVEALQKKGVVTNIKDGSVIGEITDVDVKPMKVQTLLMNGNTVYSEVPEKYVVRVTVNAEGKESNEGYFVGNDIELSVGSTMMMATKYVNSNGTVKKIDIIE